MQFMLILIVAFLLYNSVYNKNFSAERMWYFKNYVFVLSCRKLWFVF